MPAERLVKQELRKRARGQRIFADDWNTVVEAMTGAETVSFVETGGVPLFAEAHDDIPVFSVFYIDTMAGIGNSDETPVLTTKLADGSALRLFTNREIPMVPGESSFIEVIGSNRVKIDVDPADMGFVIGTECGPDGSSLQAVSDGTGLVCLSAPITYQTTKKYIWAISKQAGGGSGEYVIEVRWADPILEYRIGSTWYLIDTAENCAAVSPFVSGLGI